MDRSLWAVLGGTFTLRFSTGLTGTMLAVYLAKLPEHGGPVVAATTLSFLHASFYLSELGLSPIFGVLSDRVGHHRMMLVGPIFGAVAVILTGLTTNLLVLGGTRTLDPRLHRPRHGRQRGPPRQGRRPVRGRDARRPRRRPRDRSPALRRARA